MMMQRIALVVCVVSFMQATYAEEHRTPEALALSFLAVEVPRWSAENGCYSCHNNGDAARALYTAKRLGFEIEPDALADTTDWLIHPERWDNNGGDGSFSDKRLARLQFAFALRTAVEAGAIDDRTPLLDAAERLASDQADDGSWPLDGPDVIGSPATYGRSLASLVARDVLHAADPERYRDHVAAATTWLRQRPLETVLDASVELLRRDVEVPERRQRALDLLQQGQSEAGGWGPYVNSPSEPFDTALAVLALSRVDETPDIGRMLQRGRSYLLSTQLPDGPWPETTRPAGNESYAQHISTTGWAALALLATSESS